MSSTIGLSRGRYIRLMAISAVEILGTIPLGTFYIVHNSKLGVTPWRGWAFTHEHYSEVIQVPASIWKNDPDSVLGLEMYRWSLVLCAFLFFALFGFANEARQNYRRLYTSIASRIGYSTSILLGSSNAYVFYSLYVFGLDSLGLKYFFSQYFISSLREEQRRRNSLCGYNEWRQAHIKLLIFRPISDAVYFIPSRR
jgi:Pheromone A receptor